METRGSDEGDNFSDPDISEELLSHDQLIVFTG
jgi:hypothetical protein